MKVFYDTAYVGAAYAFETTRKAKWVADSLAADPISGIVLEAPASLTWDQLIEVHDPSYVRAVQTGAPRALAQSQEFTWDTGLWPMVLASNGGMVAAALEALRSGVAGTLSSGLHHARHAHGAGYCTFNGLVIAARHALAAGAQSVLILDLDAHAGGGTAELIADQTGIWQFDVSVDPYDSYAPGPRVWLHSVQHAGDYLPRIAAGLTELDKSSPRFDLCLYNAGMDPYEGCHDGGLAGITLKMLAEREQLVFDWCARRTLPVAFAMAGGYVGERLTRDTLIALHRTTLQAAVNRPPGA